MSDSNVSELEAQHRLLLRSLLLPDTVVQRGAPDFLKHFDMAFARQLLGADEPWAGRTRFRSPGGSCAKF